MPHLLFARMADRSAARRAAACLPGLTSGWAPALALATLLLASHAQAQSAGVQFDQQADGRIQVNFGDTAPLNIGKDRSGLTMTFAGKVDIDANALKHTPGLEKSRIRMDHGNTVVSLRGSQGKVEVATVDGHLMLSPEHRTPRKETAQKSDRPEKTELADNTEKPEKQEKPGKGDRRSASRRGKTADEPSQAELDALRKKVAGQLALLNMNAGTDQPSAVTSGQQSGQNGSNAGNAGRAGGNMSGGEQKGSSYLAASDNSATPPPSRQAPCKALPLASWLGTGSYGDWAVALRGRLARAPDSLDALASLAEFYVAHWMPQEALALLAGWADDDPGAKERGRLLQVRDIAKLMMHQPIASDSSLLAHRDDCELPEAPVWRAMQAVANEDTQGVLTNARRAREELDEVPDPMRTNFALAIADGSHNDPETLKLMVAALRASSGGTIADVNGRWLLLAREAAVEHNSVDEELYLEHAAENPYNVPGLIASVQLAGLKINRNDQEGAHADKYLMDIARTYRHDSVGQQAALLLARHRMADGHWRAAFELADESAQADRNPGESAAAQYCAALLRLMLVDSKGKALPPTNERMALFWRYEGYATPGEPGDDIRVGAAKLLLAQHFNDSALDVTRQFAQASLKNPETLLLKAQAEALAQGGDAEAAIAMAQSQPTSDLTNTIVANALARTGRLAEAAKSAAQVNTLAGRQLRADLLYKAQDWANAASAYADLLRDSDLDQVARTEATRRYALTVELAQKVPGDAPTKSLMVTDKLSDKLQSIGVADQAAAAPVMEVRDALKRAKKIETLLGP